MTNFTAMAVFFLGIFIALFSDVFNAGKDVKILISFFGYYIAVTTILFGFAPKKKDRDSRNAGSKIFGSLKSFWFYFKNFPWLILALTACVFLFIFDRKKHEGLSVCSECDIPPY